MNVDSMMVARKLTGLVAVLLLGFLGGCAQKVQAPAKTYMFWPPTPDDPHIQFLMAISSSADVTGRQGKLDEMIYGKETNSDLPFNRPYGVRMVDGKIYVCDASASLLAILDFRTKQVRIIGQEGDGRLSKPIDVAVAPDGLRYVADTGLGSIVVFDDKDQYAGKISLPGMRPVSLAISQNELYVADMAASRVRVFDRMSGKELRTIGEPGAGPGHMGGAMGVALDRQGNVYVNDVLGCRVQKFTRDGKFISSLGGVGDLPGLFVRPKHMAIDASGILYVVDNAFQNVQMFNEKSEMLMFFGAPGTHPGAMDMPTGICVDDVDLELFASYVHPAFQAQRLVIVTNNFGPAKIMIYALGELKPGKTVADISSGRITTIVGFRGNDAPAFKDNAPVPTTEPTTQPATQMGPTTLPQGLPTTGGGSY